MRPIAFQRMFTRIDHGQSGYKFVNLRYRVVPGNAAVIVPKDVCDGALAYVRLSQSHPDGGPQIVIAQVGQVRIFLAGGATNPLRHAVLLIVWIELRGAVAGDDLRDRIRVRAVPEAIQHVD
jgi:hypothetical protein